MALQDGLVREFSTFVKRSEDDSEYIVSRRAVELLRDIMSQRRWQNAKELMDLIRTTGQALNGRRPAELIVGNMVRRVLRLIRDAYALCFNQEQGEAGEAGSVLTMPSLQDLLLNPEVANDYSTPFKNLKTQIMQSINDLLEELESSAHNIAQQSLEHIHANEVIMTFGYSHTVEAFLLGAAQKRKFQVVVAEADPSNEGHKLATTLGSAGVETTLITDSAVFAIMSRVNKVILGTCAVMADGGLLARSGCHALALAAHHHNVPVIVCASMFKLCPRYLCSYAQDTFSNISSPTEIAEYASPAFVDKVDCINPRLDYVPPELVSLFVSNLGGNAPSYVYRVLSEYYHEDDFELAKEPGAA